MNHDTQAFERLREVGREADEEDRDVRPSLKWWRVSEAGEPVARVMAFSAEAAAYVVTMARRKDGLATSAVSAVEDKGNDRATESFRNLAKYGRVTA